jgi:hypothetical protein
MDKLMSFSRRRAMSGFLALYCACLGINLGRSVWYELESPERQLFISEFVDKVVHNEAYMPVQFHAYPFANAAKAMSTWLGIDLRAAYTTVFLVGYIALLLASWFWFNQLGYDARGTTIGLTVIACYGGALMWSVALEHPSDLYGTALFVLALAAASAGRIRWVLAISLAAGFIWAKHVIIGPVLFVFYVMRKEWREAFVVAISATALAWIGQSVYTAALGRHVLKPGAALVLSAWLRSLPKALVYHIAFAAPPMVLAAFQWPQVPRIVRAALVAYPMILLVYALQIFPWYEMRSFWIVVPVFGAVFALLAVPSRDQTSECMTT